MSESETRYARHNIRGHNLHFLEAEWGEAFLSFAWTVVFGYVLVESLRFRKQQDAGQDTAAD